MPRKKSTDTTEVKALRKLLLSLGLSVSAVSRLITQMDGRLADLSAKACETELYIATHPEVKSPDRYAAKTLRNYVEEQAARRPSTAVPAPSAAPRPSCSSAPSCPSVESAAVSQQPSPSPSPAPVTMELWGYD